MIYINDLRGYASKLEQKGKIIVGTVSTSRKDKQTDKYVKSYWNAKFIGGQVAEGKINITKGMLTNEKAENGKYYVNLTVFEWEQDEVPSGFQQLTEDDDIPPFLR
jgi:hypothetical protein